MLGEGSSFQTRGTKWLLDSPSKLRKIGGTCKWDIQGSIKVIGTEIEPPSHKTSGLTMEMKLTQEQLMTRDLRANDY